MRSRLIWRLNWILRCAGELDCFRETDSRFLENLSFSLKRNQVTALVFNKHDVDHVTLEVAAKLDDLEFCKAVTTPFFISLAQHQKGRAVRNTTSVV